MNIVTELEYQLSAASGWLDLGNHLEANEELEKLPPLLRAHPEVLKVRLRVYEAAGKWVEYAIIAEGAAERYSNDPDFYVAYALGKFQTKQYECAAEFLLYHSTDFPMTWEWAYLLAGVLAVLERPVEAREWLGKAFELSPDPDKLKLRALDEPELQTIWGKSPPNT